MTGQTVEQPGVGASIEIESVPDATSEPSPGVGMAAASEVRIEPGGDFVWLRRFPNPLREPLGAIAWVFEVLLGVLSLAALVTILAAVPILNLVALGYLLEVEGQVARSGKWRHALPLLPAAMRLGSILGGTLLWLVPVMLLADFVADARLIAPHGTATQVWTVVLGVVATVVCVHLLLAWSRGGSFGCFVRPIKNVRWLREQLRSGDYWPRADRVLREFFSALRPWHFLWLGARGFLGTWAWLAVPTALFGIGWHSGSSWYRLLTVASGACLVPLLAWVPFLQVRLAAENRWSAMFDVRGIRELFRHAPLSWLVATAALYALSIPLFLYSLHFRMYAPFHLGIWWDLALVSIVCTFPARAALGWAYHRATARGPAWIGWIWLSRLLLAGALALYVWLLFHTPLTHDAPPWQLQYHSLVLPIPW